MFSRTTLATCSLSQYVQYAEHMYHTSQGLLLSHALSLSDVHVPNENLWKSDLTVLIQGNCIAPIDGIIMSHLLCVNALHTRNFVVAFNHQSACVTDVVTLLRSQRGANWMLPVMYAVSSDLRIIAQKADSVSDSRGDILEKATDILMACYRVCIGDVANFQENSQRIGLMSPVNHLINIYFRTHKFNLCQLMIRAIEPAAAGQVPSTLAQQVTFRFFVGRLAVLEGDFMVANQNLLFAFKQCHPDSVRNKRIILTYLLPVKMLLGYMPPKALIDKYDLPLFWDLIIAVKQGNLKMFEEIFEGNRRYFVDMGLFIAIENLRLITYRNVFKKIYLSQGSNKITVYCFQAGLQLMSHEDVDASKTRLLIATLIYSNKMKAYLSYQCDVVIFSEENAFPRLSTLGHSG